MKRQMKKIVVTAASVAVSLAGTIPAQACNGRSGGRARISVSRSYHPVARVPVYRSYPQPVCAQPTIVRSQPAPPQHFAPRPVAPQQFAPQQFAPQQFAPQQFAPQQFAPQQLAPQQLAPQPIAPRSPAGAINAQPSVGSGPAVVNRPATQNTQVQATSQTQPASQVQPASQAQVTPQSTTPSNSNAGKSEASALQMLVSISQTEPTPAAASQIPQFTPAASQSTASHVGNWKVNLSGNQSVELTLNSDGSFIWTATKNGKSSNFQGQFRLESDRLTLVRSSDLQQMAGSWAGAGDQFTFKLDGATTGGLSFQRG